MSEPVVKAAVLAVLATVAGLIIKRGSSEMSAVLALAVCAAVFSGVVGLLDRVLETMDRARELSGLSPAFFAPLLKCVGIAFTSRLAADMCKDGGQGAMASAVELIGAVGAVYTALPLISTLMDMLESII